MNIRVTIADDHPILLQGLEYMLSKYSQITLCDICRNGDQLLSSLKKQQPDVLLLDIQMPGKQGDELALIVSQAYPLVSILTLTNLDQTFHVRNMFLNGAKGYLLKSADQFTLIQAIETVHKGSQYVDPNLRTQMLQELLEERAQANAIPHLTKRELEILKLIAEGCTSTQISKKLFISLSTVENHRFNISMKLGVKNAVELLRKAIQMGLIKA